MEFFNTFPFTKLQGKNRGLDWVMQKMGIFQAEIDKIPDYVEKAVENVDISGNVAIDETLTRRGFAADAGEVGDRFSVCDSHFFNTANPHAVTADQIGAAPAGFGLGTVQPVEWGNIDNITANGWYSAIVNGEITSGASAYMVWIRVDGLDTNYACQTVYTTGADCVLERHKQAGVWGEWEWKNPSMFPGVEYRTTERNEGKAVYATRVSVGTLVADGEVQNQIRAGNTLTILRFSGQFGNHALPNTSYGVWVDVQAVNASTMLIRMHTDEPALVGSPVYVSIWYTKD